MEHETTERRSRKRRRISSSEDVPDRPETNTRVSNKNMTTQQATTLAPLALPSLFEDFRSIITCKICFRLLYEPFTLACGHTHCYSCLCEWFGRTEDRRKTCPDCRAAVKQTPAPAYTVRELTQKYITHPECLPEGESTQQHEKARAEESAMVEAERGVLAGAGLFRGMFNKPERLRAMVDEEDGVARCPYCAWELEPGHGVTCIQCGRRHNRSDSDEYNSEDDLDENDLDAIEYPHGWPPQDADQDEDTDDDDMDDEDAIQLLDRDPFGPPPGAGFETGGETYFVSSGDDDVASVQEIGRGRRRFPHRDDQSVVELMRADGEARRDALSRQLVAHERNLINGGHIPHRRREPRGSTSPGHPSDVDSDDEEEDYDSDEDAGSLDDFVVREDEESTIQHEPEFSSMYDTDEDDVDITVSIQAGGSDSSDGQSSNSDAVTRRARRRHQQEMADRHAQRGRGGGHGRGRAPIMVSDPSSSEDDNGGVSASPEPITHRRRAGRVPAARTEEESAEEAIQRVLDETDHNSSDEQSAEEAIQRVLDATEGVEGSSSEEKDDDEDDLPVRRGRARR